VLHSHQKRLAAQFCIRSIHAALIFGEDEEWCVETSVCLSSLLGWFGNPGEMLGRVIPQFFMFCFVCLICTIVVEKIFCFCFSLHSFVLGHFKCHLNMLRYSGFPLEVKDNG